MINQTNLNLKIETNHKFHSVNISIRWQSPEINRVDWWLKRKINDWKLISGSGCILYIE